MAQVYTSQLAAESASQRAVPPTISRRTVRGQSLSVARLQSHVVWPRLTCAHNSTPITNKATHDFMFSDLDDDPVGFSLPSNRQYATTF
mmetsp:Transcript_2639/g.4655  ORF Transcript_2639/g.4655 Transcript_2639/m.4655 type:complete len:89 (+) Transcript_2639:112-378(+)